MMGDDRHWPISQSMCRECGAMPGAPHTRECPTIARLADAGAVAQLMRARGELQELADRFERVADRLERALERVEQRGTPRALPATIVVDQPPPRKRRG